MSTQTIDMLDKITTEQEAIEVANEIERIESALKIMKANLEEYVKIHGELDTGTKVWGFRTTESFKFKEGGVVLLCGELFKNNIDHWKYLNITAPNLRQIQRKLNLTDEQLNQYGSKVIRQSFRAVKSK